MRIPHFHLPSIRHTRILSHLGRPAIWLLLIVAALLLTLRWRTASHAALAQPAGGRYGSDRHKLRVTDARLARELVARGARIVGDYGSYQLLTADAATTQAAATNSAVELRDEENLILLNAGSIDTTQPAVQAQRGAASLSLAADGSAMHLVQFAGPIKPEWYDELAATGVQIVAYIPYHAYLVYGDSASLGRLQNGLAQASYVQWDGAYQAEFKLDRSVRGPSEKPASTAPADDSSDLLAIQLFSDEAQNRITVQLVDALKLEPVLQQSHVLHYRNLIIKLPDSAAEKQLAARPDVVSIRRYVVPIKYDERQNRIMAGNLTAGSPTPGDYLAYLAANGFTQAQFTASGFAVNVSDSGIDDGTIVPNHFGLYVGGNSTAASRVIYSRLEGTPNSNSTLQGCDGHGTINAHIIAGFVPSGTVGGVNYFAAPHADASQFRYGLGVAPFVKVGSSVIFDPNNYTFPNFANLESKAYQDGARLSSNSWGTDVSGAYNIDSQAYDALVRDAQPTGSTFPMAGNQEYVIVFAAGNAGPTSGSVGSPGTAKNVISVGAAENVQAFGGADSCNITDTSANSANDIISFSSRGPTADGRRKPELVAPGTHVSGGAFQTTTPGLTGQADACFNGGGVCGGTSGSNFFPAGQQFYTASSGTSHSTAGVTGAAALVRQRFINAGLTPPSPAMTKAALMNSARYLNGTDANDNLWSNNQGMGEVNLGSFFDVKLATGVGATNSLLRDQVAADTFTASGQTRLFTGLVADNTKPLRVTLAWTDAPGSTTGNSYVNNLDLEVTIGGQTYKGNVFSGATSTTGGAADVRNNVESVLIPAGVSGSLIVRVLATNIAGDGVPNVGGALDQDFALLGYNLTEMPLGVMTGGGSAITAENCAAGNGVADPGETVTVNLTLQNIGTANTNNLIATLQATGGVTAPSTPQTYGAVTMGGPAVTKPFNFTASGTCGGAITATLTLQDGPNNLGQLTFTFPLGTSILATQTFSNAATITIPAGAPGTSSGAATPYPSNITAAGLSGTVSKVTVTLTNLNHSYPDDVDILLVGPGGQKLLLMSDVGGDPNLINANLTFDDTGPPPPDTTQISSGTFSPTNSGEGDTFSAPAPAGPYLDPQRLAVFNGTNPNGVWSLYVVDDAGEDSGSIIGGWSLSITTATPSCCAAGCTLTCPMNVTANTAPNMCNAVVNYAPPTPSGCGAVTCLPPTGSVFAIGVTTVVCSTAAGPACSFTVTVNDMQPPTFTCPANISVIAAGATNVNYTTPPANDNCTNATVNCTPPSGALFSVGTTTVTCTATDAVGNDDDCSFTVTICTATIAPTNLAFAANGGSGVINVTSSGSCNWTAGSNAPAWITVGGGGSGSGSVSFSVAAHTNTTNRSGTITVAGQTFTVLQGAQFLDVPIGASFYTEIGKLSARGITLGCGSGNYCPDSNVTREQMAIFIERALGVFTPPAGPATPTFADVPNSGATDFSYEFIEDFVSRGITLGCDAGPPRLYCPLSNVTREQMAIFIIRALGVFTPPAGPATPTFADVPNSGATDFSYEFIEEFVARGITSGCATGPPRLYCPTSPVTRRQMAVFLVRAFNL
jgi:subtilisin-like proprotein convertase family protein